MSVSLSAIPRAFHPPRLDWAAVRAWIDSEVAEADREQAWVDVVCQWLAMLNEALGGTYRVERSEHLFLFAPRDNAEASRLLRVGESGLAVISDALGALACESWLGPAVVLLFSDTETYCRFVSPHSPDDERIRSGAVCFREAYIQIALRPLGPEFLRRAIVHELAHACLVDLDLPLWLEEGITQLAEEGELEPWARFRLDAGMAEELRAFWRSKGLSEFWWGKSFYALDESQSYSYQLAEVLFRLIISDHRRSLRDFVRHAKRADAGEGSAKKWLGRGLAEVAAQFLGKGEWRPVPYDYDSYTNRGLMYLAREQYQESLADLDEAVRLSPSLADAYINRGVVHYQVANYAAAAKDYRKAIELNANDSYANSGLAWILATCPSDEHRDGVLALEHAEQALEHADLSDEWRCFGVLAAAYAEVRDFSSAVKYATKSLRRAPDAERGGCDERLSLYRQDKPYREVVIPPPVGSG